MNLKSSQSSPKFSTFPKSPKVLQISQKFPKVLKCSQRSQKIPMFPKVLKRSKKISKVPKVPKSSQKFPNTVFPRIQPGGFILFMTPVPPGTIRGRVINGAGLYSLTWSQTDKKWKNITNFTNQIIAVR